MVMGDDYISRVIDRMPRPNAHCGPKSPWSCGAISSSASNVDSRSMTCSGSSAIRRRSATAYLAAEPLIPASFWQRGAAKASTC